MNRDTAELPIVESGDAHALSLAPPAAGAPAGVVPAPPRPGVRAALRARAARALRLGALDAGQLAAARDSWRALWSSRLLVFAAGVGTVVTLGMGPARNAFNPPGVTHGFGRVADVLVSPVARWDSDWYLVIAHWGYQTGLGAATASRTAYFPLYPLLIRALAFAFVPLIVAGVLVSLVAFALALYGIHRLTSLELGGASAGAVDAPARARAFASRRSARLAVLIVAFSPMALFFSAVYSESLYLALTVAFFWSARHGRWATAGVLGALAGATRSTGLVLVAPALILYLYGPRADRRADFAWRGVLARRLLPRYRPRASLLWLALLPAGFAAYGGWLALSGGHFFGPFHTEQAWGRHFAGPYVGAWDGIRAAFEGARQLLSFQRAHLYWPAAAYGSPFIAAAHNLANVAFLLAAAALVLGTFRRLPFAYGVYALAALALPLSYPVAAQPLMSLPRYMVVLFPLSMRLAAWLSDRPRSARAVLVAFALLIVLFVGQFATWHWVA